MARLNPRWCAPIQTLSRTYMQSNRFEEARAVVSAAIEQKRDTPGMHRILYEIALIQGDTGAAERAFELGKPAPRARLLEAAAVAAFQGRLSQARKLFKEADDRAGAARLDALFADGRQTQAALEQAFQLQPGAGGAAAAMLAISGEDEVLRALERIQKDRSQDTLLSLLVATTARQQAVRAGNGTRAIEWLNGAKAIRAWSRDLPAIYTRGLSMA